jgi:SAM-dependent methyltransferase
MTRQSSGYEDQQFVAELYDPVYDNLARHDVEFYVEYAKKANGKTLELGCGTGRVLIPTAQAGCEITGLDFSPFMLDKCREKLASQTKETQSHAKLIQGDMTKFNLGEQYTLITIPFRPFQHLITTEEQKACLNCVRLHLKEGGLFIFDVFHPYVPRLTDPKYLMEIDVDPRIELSDGRVLRRTTRTVAFHRDDQYNELEIIHYVKYIDGREERLVHSFPMRYFYRFEMEHLLALSGFKIKEFFGDFDRSPFNTDSPEMIFVAEKV